MSRWQLRVAFCIALVGAMLLTIPAQAEPPSLVRIPSAALREERGIDRLLLEGGQLEEAGRWADAVTLYEEGLRDYPSHQLRQRLDVARIHYDLERRFADEGYLRTVRESSERQSMEVLAEVLLKIDAYHVDSPDWGKVIERGTESLQFAVAVPAFRQQAEHPWTDREVDAVRRQINLDMRSRPVHSRQDAMALVNDLATRLEQQWSLPASATIFEFTCNSLSALDWYSSYLTREDYEEVISQIDGNFVGLGVELQPNSDHLEIINVIANGPAGEAGVRPGDHIVAIDRTAVSDLGGDRAADLLRGADGSYLLITVRTPGGHAHELRIQRRRVDIPSIEDVRLIDASNGVGYFRVTSFQRTTLDETKAALWQLHREGMRSLIIDVRGNPGGLLDSAVDLANLFLTQGSIVSTRGRNPNENRDRTAWFEGTWQVPLTVLIDRDSASASEIFAGAIGDHRRGTLVGERTYGKGSVQGIFPLNAEGGGIRLTTAKFYSPSGQAISRQGVLPDIPVQVTLRVDARGQAVESDTDAILAAGLRAAVDQVARR